ncbi:MAG: putative Serine/threonine-protein kinase TOUSLED [Streblomastix strix]|uniref:Putative Serine/threonine-protein kinase TOUSLED n=1 Tax=Streblomastix strix TaxID=222440 RepID=A0A5J4VVB5_9EUKA|nr:MAG: putative Serine/threonine-protein kinase TOUSLED [Streblomastix strix]
MHSEEKRLEKRKHRLEQLKAQHIAESRRMRNELLGRFQVGIVLKNRYICTGFLGSGGFSSVYKAIDVGRRQITNNDEKIINSESSKKTIIDKENKVHQRQPYFSENEARLIIAQIFSALVHLSSLENPVIHYDIKPANILFHNGRAMLTDFGLSKVIESEARPEFNFNIIQQGSIKTDEGVGQLKIKQSTNLLTSAQSNPSDTSIITQSIPQPPLHIFGVGNTAVGQTLGGTPEIELTSQGAGTYWYLPPECFQHTDEFSRWPQSTVRISSKVDVWSVGVILYQMLCGTRPYAHRESPQEILLHHTQIFTREVTFPTNVSISDEAKDFIRKCLTHSPMQRMDSRLALMHPFLQPITKCGEISII